MRQQCCWKGRVDWLNHTACDFPFFFFLPFLSTSPLQNTDKDVLHNQAFDNEKKNNYEMEISNAPQTEFYLYF